MKLVHSNDQKVISFYYFIKKKCGNNCVFSLGDIEIFIELSSQLEFAKNSNDILKIMDKYHEYDDSLIVTLFDEWTHTWTIIEKAKKEIKKIEKEEKELTTRKRVFKQIIDQKDEELNEEYYNNSIQQKQKEVLNNLSNYLKERLNYVILKNEFMDEVIGILSSVMYEKDLTLSKLSNAINNIRRMVTPLDTYNENVIFVNDLVNWIQEQFKMTFY
jgi:hypothetical protein